ncbi:RNA helicase [Aphelenchoides fujianensis]|nr:RNA helicase [Aphelenchoides fujianensis]
MSEAEQQPATAPPPSEQPADAAQVAESVPAENPPADGAPADEVAAEEPPTQQQTPTEAESEDAVVDEVVTAAVVTVEAEVQPPKSAEQSEAVDSPPKDETPPKAEEPPTAEEPPREEPPREDERPKEVEPPPPEGEQQPAALPNEQPEVVEGAPPPAEVVEERPQEAAAEDVESFDEEPPLDRVPLPLVPRSHELDHEEEEFRRQQQAQFELKANRVEGPRVPFQFAERRAEDLWEDDDQPQAEAEQDEEEANGEAEGPDELPPTPPSLAAQDEAASTRSLAGSLAGSELRIDGDSKPQDAPAEPAASDEQPPVETEKKPEDPKAEVDEQKEAADAKADDEKPQETQETTKVEPPVPERQDSWENDGFNRDSKPAARPSQDLVDPWASDKEDPPPAPRKISTVADDDPWGDDVPTVTSEQWKAAPDPEPKKVEENRAFSSPSHNPRGGGNFGGSSRGGAPGRGSFAGRGRGGYEQHPARNDYQRSNGRGDGHRPDENFRSDRHTSSYEEPKRPSANNFGNTQRSFGGQDDGGWHHNRSAPRSNDRPNFPQHPNNNFNDNNRQSTGGYASGGRAEANGGYNAHNPRSFGGHQQSNDRFEDERQYQHASSYNQQDRQHQQQSYDSAPHKRQSEAKVNEWLHEQHSQDARSQDARSQQQRPQYQYRRQPNEQERHENNSDWGNRSTGSGQRGGGGYERNEYHNSHVQGGRQPANERYNDSRQNERDFGHQQRDFGHQQQHHAYGSQQADDQWNTSNGYENSKPFGGNGDHARHEPRGGFRSNDYEQPPQNGDRPGGFGHSEGGFRDFGRGQDNNNRDYQRDYQRENRGDFDRRSHYSGGAANERGRNEHSRPGHEQLREGEAPSFRHTLFGGYVPKDRPAHEPSFRSTDEIFEDDEQKKDRYAVIADEDGGVVVHNLPHNEEVQVMDTWKDAMLDETIIANVTRAGYPRPRNFQRYAFPVIYDGRDLMGQAETGAGKSVAFLLPIIQKLSQQFKGTNKVERLHRCAVLVIEPTRELAIQLFEQAKKLATRPSR